MTTIQKLERVIQAAGSFLILVGVMISGCSKAEAPGKGKPEDSSRAYRPAGPRATAVRGTISTVTDSMLVVSTTAGDIRVALASAPEVYSRGPAELSEVKESSFVGVTSVAQADGSQRATEIHIFPEELRGTNEGSFLMRGQPGAGSPSTMTNGTVETPRMTNGTIGATAGGKLTVNYRGGSQTITVPSTVTVTKISRTDTKLAPGSNVVVLATKRPDGTLTASRVLLASGR
ncbi:MAG TPA: DUF5666 domain-containing protein [Gemmatimonadaceae bacterium]